ncbi:MAG: hypothetical protein P9X24_15640 [Candidatus Hatepunaea meridiana]|nr:hypothetical protein [Candidatus Hatepunaea meridiana]
MSDNDSTGTPRTDKIPVIDLTKELSEADKISVKTISKDVPLKQVHPITKIGFYLAIIVFVYITAVTGVLLTDYFNNSPQIPSICASDTTGIFISAIDGYERLSEITTNRSLKLFDQLIHKTILPVLTSILGYIFGIRGFEKREE